MKTTKFFSVLSLALILFAATSASSENVSKKDGQIVLNAMVNYQVTVSLSLDKKICNVYQVEILDGHGQLVAPAKTFSPGVTSYNFYERGPVTGVRVAVLVLSPVHSHFSCETELFTAPAIQQGKFLPGQIYRYELVPQAQPFKN